MVASRGGAAEPDFPRFPLPRDHPAHRRKSSKIAADRAILWGRHAIVFKNINDTWGHLAGDHVLRETARIVADSIRHEDIFGRYGGEEFALLLPEVGLAGALQVCERLRQKVEAMPFVFGKDEIRVTASFGLASTLALGDVPEVLTLIELADGKLYEAKDQGRNRVIV